MSSISRILRTVAISFASLVLLVSLSLAILHYGFIDASGKGQQIKTELSQAFIDADRVDVIVHSDEFDYRALGASPYKEIEYKRKTLNDEEFRKLESYASKSSRRTQRFGGILGWSRCIFMDHHSIVFYKDGKQIRRVRLCFLCEAAQTDKMSKSSTWYGLSSLREAFETIGIEADADWSSLADAAIQKGEQAVPPKSDRAGG